MSSFAKNILAFIVMGLVAYAIFWLSGHFMPQIPVPVIILIAIFSAIFVSLLLPENDVRAKLDETFSRVSVIVLGSWLGMALTMGSMTIFMAAMKDDMRHMSKNMQDMSADIQGMSGDMREMKNNTTTMSTHMTQMSGDMANMSKNMQTMGVNIANMDTYINNIDDEIIKIDDEIRLMNNRLSPSIAVMAPAVNDMGRSMHRGVQSFSNPMDYMRNAFLP